MNSENGQESQPHFQKIVTARDDLSVRFPPRRQQQRQAVR